MIIHVTPDDVFIAGMRRSVKSSERFACTTHVGAADMLDMIPPLSGPLVDSST